MMNLETLRQELDALPWNDLRKRARDANIGLLPEHKKEDIIQMLLAKAKSTTMFNEANKDAPVPAGYVRININQGYGTSNGYVQGEEAVEMSVNRRFFTIPRGVPVDVPKYVANALRDSNCLSVECNEKTNYRKTVKMVQSYPFSVITEGPPGEVKDKFAARRRTNLRLKERQDYFRKHGRFPTEREMKEIKGLPVRDFY